MTRKLRNSEQHSALAGIPVAMADIFCTIGALLSWRRPAPDSEAAPEDGFREIQHNFMKYQAEVGGYFWRAFYRWNPEHYHQSRLESDHFYRTSGYIPNEPDALR